MEYHLKEIKVILVLQGKEMDTPSWERNDKSFSPIIMKLHDGEIINKDDIISEASELFIVRRAYDCHGNLIESETKMTSDAAIIGPISDNDRKFWYNWYTEAL